MTDILQAALKNKKVHANLHKREDHAWIMRQEFIDDRWNMTAERLFKHNKIVLDADILNLQRQKLSNLIKIQTTKQNNRIAEFNDKCIKCYDVLTLNSIINTLTVSQLKAVCAFKKRKVDKALPTTKLPLKNR